MCRDCRREYDSRRYHAQDGAEKQRLHDKQKRLAERNRRYVNDFLLEHPCVDCGEQDPIVLQFDHRDQEEKSHNVCDMVKDCYSTRRIQQEIDKCDVRCANCHARRTARQFGWYAQEMV